MAKILNFDQFISAKNREVIKVTIYGKEYTVPCEIPAIVPVMMARAEQSLNAGESTRMIFRAADALFGVDTVNELCAKGMSSTDMSVLVQKVFDVINGKDEDPESEELSDEDSRVSTSGKRAEKK